MNSAAAIEMPLPPLANAEVVRVLEDVLLRARRGEVIGVGVVAVQSGGVMACMATGPEALIYVGCDQLQAALLAQMSGKRSPILMPR